MYCIHAPDILCYDDGLAGLFSGLLQQVCTGMMTIQTITPYRGSRRSDVSLNVVWTALASPQWKMMATQRVATGVGLNILLTYHQSHMLPVSLWHGYICTFNCLTEIKVLPSLVIDIHIRAQSCNINPIALGIGCPKPWFLWPYSWYHPKLILVTPYISGYYTIVCSMLFLRSLITTLPSVALVCKWG